MEYVWHIVMKNGKEYDVVTDNGDVVSFMERIININTYNDYKLSENNYNKNNMVMLNSNEISSVEYRID
ncbi:hypothetical protein [Clostridium butyricum]|uniref:hypothetical protein n=1 Tax=Clostridium butyricum TaxID=1492 RepID=UPI00325AEC4A